MPPLRRSSLRRQVVAHSVLRQDCARHYTSVCLRAHARLYEFVQICVTRLHSH